MYSSSGNVEFQLFLLKQLFTGGKKKQQTTKQKGLLKKWVKFLRLWCSFDFFVMTFKTQALLLMYKERLREPGLFSSACSVQRPRGDFIAVLIYQMRRYREDRARLFSEVYVKGNGHRLQQGKFWLSIRETVQRWDFVENLNPQRFSNLTKQGPEQHFQSWPCFKQRFGLDHVLRSLPN